PNRHFAEPQPHTMGVSLREQADHWVVNGLIEGSNADRAGLRRGDRVEQINGLTPSDFGSLTFDSLPDRLTLQVRRAGELVEIAFEKE
ncbi:MAG: PDZ domain-containing protein, partial [Alistipes sp.]|nr:PDZ domain-containing protein [Alistipes sp.]